MKVLAPGFALLAMASTAGDAGGLKPLDDGCALVQRIYPVLMLAVMAEAPVDCGDPDSGVSVDCDAGETAEQKAKHARRLEIREHQEAAFKQASEACEAYAANRKSPALREAAVRAFNAAREIGTDLPAELK
jgi:hypothetical protein